MKRLLLALLIGGLLVLALVTVAMADNGPHGSFTATTDACASCHRAHSAAYGRNALLVADPEALCDTCHDGSGAATNVVDGVYHNAGSPYPGVVEGTDGASLFGGGFEHALMATAWSGATTADPAFNAVSRPTTSNHTVGFGGTIWGAGANDSPTQSMFLECTSCHDPHGTSGWQIDPTGPNTADVRVASYRLLRWQPAASNGFTAPAASVNWSSGAFPVNDGGTSGWLVPDNFAGNGNEWYTIGTTNAFAAGDYLAGRGSDVYNPTGHDYRPAARNYAYFCAQCHDRYFANSRLRNHEDASVYCGEPVDTGTLLPDYPDADGVFPWIHPVDPVRCLPVTNSTTGALTGWGDDGSRGDAVYMYQHSSGDQLRASMDGTAAADTRTTINRTCAACHVAHGTAAQMTALAGSASLAQGSVLLRQDNRSICLRCHAGNVNFTVGP